RTGRRQSGAHRRVGVGLRPSPDARTRERRAGGPRLDGPGRRRARADLRALRPRLPPRRGGSQPQEPDRLRAMKVAVVGGGILGLTLAHRLTRAGHAVDLLEAGPVLGGLVAPQDYGPFVWDRFYHCIL